MSWLNLNQSLNSLKGQLTNFASEVLAEGAGAVLTDAEGRVPTPPEAADTRLRGLEEKCALQGEEIAALRKLNSELQASLLHKGPSESSSVQNGVVHGDDEPWFWDPPPPAQTSRRQSEQAADQFKIQALEREISELKLKVDAASDAGNAVDVTRETADEVEKLREENARLAGNLEDLDEQHQLAMERMLTLKKELQKNFQILKQEHEELKSTNDQYAKDVEQLKSMLAEKDAYMNRERESLKADYETLQHKYINLERVYNVLQETTEKFQEENQELQEEVFKLQEELSNRGQEDGIEELDMVPREKYEALLKEVMQIQENKDSAVSVPLDDTNIDDNAKSVIKNLKQDIFDLKLKLANASSPDASTLVAGGIDIDKLNQIYNRYINFDLPAENESEETSVTAHSDIIHKIELAFKTLSVFKNELDILRHTILESEQNERYLQTQIDDLTSDNEILSADLMHCEGELSDMKKNNDFLLTEITAMKNVSKLEPIIESHEDNIVKLETELADCNQINKTIENEIKAIQEKLSEVHDEKVFLQSDLSDLRNKYNQMLIELDTYKTNLALIQDQEKTSENDEHAKLQEAVEEIEELKRKLDVSIAKNEQLSIDRSIAENETIILTQNLEELKLALEEREMKAKKIAILENKLDDLEKNVSEVTKLKKEVELDRQLIVEKLKTLANETDNLDQIETYYVTFQSCTQDVDNYIAKIISKLVQFKKTESDLHSQIEELKNCSHIYESAIENLRMKLVNNGVQSREIEEENMFPLETQTHLQSDLELTQEKLAANSIKNNTANAEVNEKDDNIKNILISKENCPLKDQIDKLNNELQTYMNRAKKCIGESSLLRNRISQYQSELEKLKSYSEEKEKEVEGLSENKLHILEAKIQLEHDLASSQKKLSHFESQLSKLEFQFKHKQNEIERLNSTIQSNNENLTTLNEAVDSLKNTIEIKDAEICRLRNVEQAEQCSRVDDFVSHETNEASLNRIDLLKNETEDLKSQVAVKEDEANSVRSQMESLHEGLNEKQAAIDALNSERNELINFITLKHNENVHYHSEIQRLNQVVMQHVSDYKSVSEECEKLKLELENCSECAKLKETIKEKDEKLMEINESTGDTELTKRDLSNATELIRSLTEKCEELDKNLTIQLNEVKNLTTEKAQLSEREQSLSRELERLRHHLVETEESHTREMLAAEGRLAECRAQLTSVEERAKQTGTVYTSNNIRAHQELETLRAQLRLLERQREEAQARLAGAEDEGQRSRAALATLQLVIEQFQSEKERDIEAATARVRSREEEARRESAALRAEMAGLTARLNESLAGLKAAARLGDQLELKNAQLQEYKEQVSALREAVRAGEERCAAATRQHGRVDKGLVKNLLLNYLQAADMRAADRIQVLRILSTVLDFNQQECEKVGLARGANAPGADSLAREFVRFLEKESRPSVLPTMMGLADSSPADRSATPRSRKSSHQGPQAPEPPPGHRRSTSSGSNNALFQHMEPALDQTRNSEGAILKHALRDV